MMLLDTLCPICLLCRNGLYTRFNRYALSIAPMHPKIVCKSPYIGLGGRVCNKVTMIFYCCLLLYGC